MSLSGALVDLVPLTIAAGLTPVALIFLLTFLRGEKGLQTGTAFLSGIVAVRLMQGIVFGLILGNVGGTDGEAATRTFTSTLLLVLGVLMLNSAIRKFSSEADPDDPPPRWMTVVSTATPLKALGLGALAMMIAGKHWVFTLGAIGTIQESDLARNQGIMLYLIFVFVVSLPLLTPILGIAVSPRRASIALKAVGDWMDRNNRIIMIAVYGVFGAYFLIKGVTGLIS
jgi:hypothetical protein